MKRSFIAFPRATNLSVALLILPKLRRDATAAVRIFSIGASIAICYLASANGAVRSHTDSAILNSNKLVLNNVTLSGDLESIRLSQPFIDFLTQHSNTGTL